MTLIRLLPAALLICTLPAFSQNQPTGASSTSNPERLFFLPGDYFSFSTTPAEAWMLMPDKPVDVGGGNALDRAHLDQHRADSLKGDTGVRTFPPNDGFATIGPVGERRLEGDQYCLKIRSYVVARDNKDSDSTHPVSYSTCQPASRYGLKTTEIRTESGH